MFFFTRSHFSRGPPRQRTHAHSKKKKSEAVNLVTCRADFARPLLLLNPETINKMTLQIRLSVHVIYLFLGGAPLSLAFFFFFLFFCPKISPPLCPRQAVGPSLRTGHRAGQAKLRLQLVSQAGKTYVQLAGRRDTSQATNDDFVPSPSRERDAVRIISVVISRHGPGPQYTLSRPSSHTLADPGEITKSWPRNSVSSLHFSLLLSLFALSS